MAASQQGAGADTRERGETASLQLRVSRSNVPCWCRGVQLSWSVGRGLWTCNLIIVRLPGGAKLDFIHQVA